MNIQKIIDELLLEVSVCHPIPDFRDREHLNTLLTVCEERGYGELIPLIEASFLNEAPDGEQSQAQKMGLVHLGRGYYGKKKGGPASHRSEDGKIVPLKPDNTAGGTASIEKAVDTAKEKDKEDSKDPFIAAAKGETGEAPEEKEKSKEEEEHEAAINTPEKVLNDPKASARSIAVARAQQAKNNTASAGEEENADVMAERPQPEGFDPVQPSDVVEELPKANADAFVGKSELPEKQGTEELEQFNTNIEKLAKIIADAKEKGGNIPNVNLCQVSVPGTNLYCDGNLGIPREEMPQFKGKPIEGSRASKMPLDKSGEVDTEPVFKEMLKQKGIKTIQTEMPADKLKATQSELVAAKVLGMMGALDKDPNHPGITAPIYVSRDGYVVDGHHRWAAVVAYNAKHPNAQIPMRVTVIDDDIRNVIPMANKFAEDIGIAAKKADANKEGAATPPTMVKNEMPKADAKAFSNKSDIPSISDEDKKSVSMKIDELNKLVADAKAKGEKAPNYNLCKITIPGTNLYCDNNLGIPREDMPQFKGTPQPGTPADKMPKDKSGEVDTEPLFRKMLAEKGIKTLETEVPSDRLKATQSELVGAKVAGMTAALEKDPNHPAITAPIYVSRDGYVIDGHHRWAAVTSAAIKANTPANMKVIVIDMDSKDIIPMANKFAEEQGIAAKKADANKEAPTTKPIAEPKVTDDKPGEVGRSDSGKKFYSLGGGYYSDTPDGEAKYIRVESIVDLAIETDKQIWWNLLFETAINGELINEDNKKNPQGPTVSFKDAEGNPGLLLQLPKSERDKAKIQSKKSQSTGNGEDVPTAKPSQSPQQSFTEPVDSEDVSDETESEAESEEDVEMDLDKLSKTAKQRESSLGEKEKAKLNNLRNKLFKEKISKIKDKPKGIKAALRKAVNGESLTKQEKVLLNDYIRIVEPTSKKPNTFRIYIAKEPGNFDNKFNVNFTGDSSEGALIRDVMGSNGVRNIATSAFGGKKSTAGQIYDDGSGKTATLEPQPSVEKDTTTGEIKSIKFGNTILERLDENEEGISKEEKLIRERSNRNLDEFGKQIEEGKLKFVDTDSGRYPDTAENRSFIIKDSLKKMHDRLFTMAEKAGAKPDSEAMQLLNRLKKLSTEDPNQNSEEWYKKYNDLFHDIAESKEEPKLGEAWANIAEIWVTLGELQGKGNGTEKGIIAVLPESTTLETVDVIKLGRSTNDVGRTIVTIDGISVKKEAGGASAMVPKMKKTFFKDLKEKGDGKKFKEQITTFGKGGARNIYGYPNTLKEAKKECAKWDNYEKLAKDGKTKRKKAPTVSKENCIIVNGLNSEQKYNKIILSQQSGYQNQMSEQSREWEKNNRLPAGYTDRLISQMNTESKENGMIWNALEKLKLINPIYKDLDERERELWEKQMLAKLQNYYLHIYISHAAYNQNVESQDFENDSVYATTDKKTGEGTIEIYKSDGIQTLSFMNPAFNVGWNPTGTPSNFAAGRLVPLEANSGRGRAMGSFNLINTKQPAHKSTSGKKSVKKSKKESFREILHRLPTHLKEKIVTRLKETLRK